MSENQTQPVIRLEINGAVASLILCRPDRQNAMGMAFFRTLRNDLRQLDDDPAVRVVVIRGEGKNFTVGLDLVEASGLMNKKGADGREQMKRIITELQESISAVERFRKPVIAAVHGYCIGGGVDLLAACDIRIASADACFSIRETRMAIIADLGTLQRLPHIIGHGWFRELALTGRDFTAADALKMGFVTHVREDRESLWACAKELADEISALPPLTVQGVKETINYSRDAGVYPGLSYVAQKNAASLGSEDLMEAVTAFMEKRKPVFKGK